MNFSSVKCHACCNGGEETELVARQELGRTIVAEVSFQQVFIKGGIVNTPDIRAQSFCAAELPPVLCISCEGCVYFMQG